jgi:hypothetical protein
MRPSLVSARALVALAALIGSFVLVSAPPRSGEAFTAATSGGRQGSNVAALERALGSEDALPALLAAIVPDVPIQELGYPFDPAQARLVDQIDEKLIYMATTDDGRVCALVTDRLYSGHPSLVGSCTHVDQFISSGLAVFIYDEVNGVPVRQEVVGILPDGYLDSVRVSDPATLVVRGNNAVSVHLLPALDTSTGVSVTVSGSQGTIVLDVPGYAQHPTETL